MPIYNDMNNVTPLTPNNMSQMNMAALNNNTGALNNVSYRNDPLYYNGRWYDGNSFNGRMYNFNNGYTCSCWYNR